MELEAKFRSFQEVQEAIKKFSDVNRVNLYTKTSRKIDACRKKCPKRVYNDDLVYLEITFACVNNGKYRSMMKTGEHPNQQTIRTGCEFAIKLRSYDGETLMVSQHGPDHNHTCTEEAFRHHPTQRRLEATDVAKVTELVNMRANKKLIKCQLETNSSRVVLLRDIHNAARKAQPSNRDEIAGLADFIRSELPDVDMQFIHKETNQVTAIFWQDAKMKENFAKFPEVLLVDAKHRLNRQKMPLYTLMVIDGNLDSQPVAFCLVVREDEATVYDMVETFKTKNPNWPGIKIIITDKDFTERKVFQDSMPEVQLQICLFHVLITFGREVTCEKSNINAEERTSVLEVLEAMAYPSYYCMASLLYYKTGVIPMVPSPPKYM